MLNLSPSANSSETIVLFRGTGDTQSGVHGKGNVYAPDVHFHDGKYWMWFGGQGHDGHDRIHLAQSNDGKTWKQLGVVLDNSTANHVNDPSLIRVGDQWFMYYTVAQTDIIDEVALATSNDGLHWKKQGAVLSASKTPAFDSLLVGRPSVLRTRGKFRMWYDGRASVSSNAPASNVPKTTHARAFVGYAESDDGFKWTRRIDKPTFEATAVHVSEVSGKLLMVYESADGTKFAVGQDGITWHPQGLLLSKSSNFDVFGHVTPFLLWEKGELYFGAASEKGWDANLLAMASLSPEMKDQIKNALSNRFQ